MNLGKLFKDFHLEKVRLNLKAIQFEVSFQEADKDAAWDLYVEMLTRIVTQPLPPEAGDEQAALENCHRTRWWLQASHRRVWSFRPNSRSAVDCSRCFTPGLSG